MSSAAIQPLHQPLLFTTSEGERELMLHSPRFRESGELERRFAVAWLEELAARPAARPDVVSVGKRVGIGRTKAYELVKSEHVLHLIREASQAHGDVADVAGSLAYDLLCRDALRRVVSGELTATNLPATTLNLLRDAQARLGRDPRLAIGVGVTMADGSSAAVGIEGSGDALQAILGKLQGATKPEASPERTELPAVEHDPPESVRGERDRSGVVDADVCGEDIGVLAEQNSGGARGEDGR